MNDRESIVAYLRRKAMEQNELAQRIGHSREDILECRAMATTYLVIAEDIEREADVKKL